MMDSRAPVEAGTTSGDAPDRDRGAVLVLTIVLTVVLSMIVLGLVTFTVTGLRTSEVSSDITERTAASTAAVYFVVEQIATVDPVACPATQTVPAGVLGGERSVTVTCTEISTGTPAEYELRSTAAGGGQADTIVATVQVRDDLPAPRPARVASWRTGA